MTAVVRIPLAVSNGAEALPLIRGRVTDTAVRIPLDRPVARGDWVRFAWTLRDGEAVWEGVGRCAACVRGEAAGKLDAVLQDLTFDPRNEAFYERLVNLGRGPATGPPTRRGPPSLPVATKNGAARPDGYSSRPPPPNGAEAFAPAPRESPTAKLSNAMRDALRPKPNSLPPSVRRRREDDSALELELGIWAGAAELARRLNVRAPALARGRWTDEKVLREALRLGLTALDTLTSR
ncbi:MAG: hypothetical protein ACFCGT_07530 [Sandaracinaceae bacterium]